MPSNIAARPGVQRSGRRLGWRAWAAILCMLFVVLALGLLLAASYRPAWYQPASIDRGLLRQDKAALVELQDQISAALNAGREARFQLRVEQINRWIAARAEIWPDLGLDLPGLDWPRVVLSDGTIRLGAVVARGGLRAVVALDCRIDVTTDFVRIYHNRGRLGAVPVPLSWLTAVFGRFPHADGLAVDKQTGALTVENNWVWPNGRRRCRLRELRVSDGQAEVVLEPWPRP